MSRERRGEEVAGEPVVLPLLAAGAVIAVMVVTGGGRYPMYVDMLAYIATGSVVWLGARQVIYQVRFRREDQAALKKDGTE